MTTRRRILEVLCSDTHCGSTLGLCPADGVRLGEGGRYTPSRVQRWMWECWLDAWSRIDAMRRKWRATLGICLNGDLVDGDHHRSVQLVSRVTEEQEYIASKVFEVPRALRPSFVHVVRGTEVHVGPSGSSEEYVARLMGAQRDPETRKHTAWHWRFELHGVLFDAQHHGRMGQRPWTETNVVALLAAQIFYEHSRRGLRHPDIAVRSHLHRYKDSHDAHPTRVIQTPSWQLKTSYAHKVVPESIADLGLVAIVIEPDGTVPLVQPILYTPELPEIWTPPTSTKSSKRSR